MENKTVDANVDPISLFNELAEARNRVTRIEQEIRERFSAKPERRTREVGRPRTAQEGTAQASVLNFILENKGKEISPKDIYDHVQGKVTPTYISVILNKLVRENKVKRIARGKYTAPGVSAQPVQH